jgi:TatD DNase family protein
VGKWEAQDALVRELKAAGFGGPASRAAFGDRPPAVVHSFSGPVEFAEQALEMGLAISFSGLVFRRGEESSADVARLVPADRLLVETDSPYLSPPGAPRRRNEPEWVSVTARWVAQQRDRDPESLGERLVEAYDRIFPRARPR